jgi:hypothetical protein
MLQNEKEILSTERKKLALQCLRYFEAEHHAELIQDLTRIETYGRIYMYAFVQITKCVRVPLMNINEQAKPLC